MPNIEISDTRLEYIEQGKGEPVIFVHGTLGDYRSWKLQMDYFGDLFHVFSYSRRYHYPNQCTGTRSDYSARLHGDDLAVLISALGLESAHIVGTSYGAYTALLMASRFPEKVRSLVLGEPPVFPLVGENPKWAAIRDAFLEKVWKPAGEKMQERKGEEGIEYFVDNVVKKGIFQQMPKGVREMIMDNVCEFKIETSSPEYWTPFTREDAKKIEIPTLLLSGDNSLDLFRFIVDELDRNMPNSEAVRIPGSTHELPSDNPKAYNEIVQGFLLEQSG